MLTVCRAGAVPCSAGMVTQHFYGHGILLFYVAAALHCTGIVYHTALAPRLCYTAVQNTVRIPAHSTVHTASNIPVTVIQGGAPRAVGSIRI